MRWTRGSGDEHTLRLAELGSILAELGSILAELGSAVARFALARDAGLAARLVFAGLVEAQAALFAFHSLQRQHLMNRICAFLWGPIDATSFVYRAHNP